MNVRAAFPLPLSVLLVAALAAPPPAFACGEGMFNTGKGLPYQTYLAPRPATVLILDTGDDARQRTLYAGLERAGHHVTVVHDTSALGQALAAGGFEVVIGGADAVAALPSTSARVLPVVPRGVATPPAWRERFAGVLVAGASLGSYLKVINRALDAGH
jgi:hypothetical protein